MTHFIAALFSLLLLLNWPHQALAETTIQLSQSQAEQLAARVWQNEGAGKDEYLVHWNNGEDFASVGIGHFIWFPEGHQEPFEQVFPKLVAFMQTQAVQLPAWLTPETPLPWPNKEVFLAARAVEDSRYIDLFALLKSTKAVQATFIANRLAAALPKMLATITDEHEQQRIRERFKSVLHNSDGSINPQGLYALIDYVNFKGEGIQITERYNGQGWGLLQVLAHMDTTQANPLKAFAEAGKAMLDRRIANSPQERGEIRWQKAWHKRLDTYWQE